MKKPKPKIKIKEDQEQFDFIKVTKNNIKNIVKDQSTIIKLNELVIKTHKIVIHAYNLIKLYYLFLYENNKKFPVINKEFIMNVFKVITQRQCGSGGYNDNNMPKQLKKLTEFYQDHYRETVNQDEVLYYDKMSYILAYEAIDMEKNINVNIHQHFVQHLNKFVNVTFDLKVKMEEIKKSNLSKEDKKTKRKELNKEFRDIKNDLITFSEILKSDNKYHEWIKEQRKNIYRKKQSFDEDNIYYDLKSKTQDYLKSMIYIGKELEKISNRIENERLEKDILESKTIEDFVKARENNKKYDRLRLFNVLPLRTNIVPKNICIDTCSLIQNFLDDESTAEHLKNYKKNSNQKKLWERFFHLDKRMFKKQKDKYTFHYMIKTDAISVSILFVRLNPNGTPMKKANKFCRSENDTKYIEKVEFTEEMKKKKIVCADPGYSDLLYCGAKDENNNLQTFRYTQNQRRLETGKKKYMKIIDKENKKVKINKKTIKKIESELTEYTAKTNFYDKFKEYLIIKNKINSQLFEHYEKQYFRKFKLNRFINTQKSESKMINNFRNKFGSEKDVVFVIGDFDKTDHMKGLEPVICRRFRRLFRNAGYPVYLINEFRTSKLCNECHEELEPFLERLSHKPKDYKQGKIITVNGLLNHSDSKLKCELIHNRDKNAVQNMLNIVEEIKRTGKRPVKFTRDENS